MPQSRLEVLYSFEAGGVRFPLGSVFGVEETAEWPTGTVETRIKNGFLRYVPGAEGGESALLLEDARQEVQEMIEAAQATAAQLIADARVTAAGEAEQILKAAGERGAEMIRYAEARAALVAELSDKTVAELVAFADEKYQVKLSPNTKRAELIERILALPTPGA